MGLKLEKTGAIFDFSILFLAALGLWKLIEWGWWAYQNLYVAWGTPCK